MLGSSTACSRRLVPQPQGRWPRAWQLALLGTAAVAAEAPPAADYDPSVGRAFAALSEAAYCKEKEVSAWSCPPCREAGLRIVPGSMRFIRQSELGQPNSTSLYIARLDGPEPFVDGCIIASRGSVTATNWIRDLQAWEGPVPFEQCAGCKVEVGFAKIWKKVEPLVVASLTEIGCVPRQAAGAGPAGSLAGSTSAVHVTGHSLGAALSTLAAFTLAKQGFDVRSSYVYESPRVGNRAFAEAFEAIVHESTPVYHITYGRDPVPHLPPRFLGYKHVAHEVYYNPKGEYVVCEGSEDHMCADRSALLPDLFHAGDHCKSPLVASGNICSCKLRQSQEIII